MSEDTQEVQRNWLKPYQYKKGAAWTGNAGGRPKGSSVKEYFRNKLIAMTEEEKEEFLHGLDKIDVWKQAEGNPDNHNENTGTVQVLLIDKDLAPLYGIRTAPEANGSRQEPNKV